MTGLWMLLERRTTVVDMDITNSTVFIPGATSGIGLGLALRLQAAGSTVVIGGRRQSLLDSLAAEHGFGTVQLDVTDPASITAAAAAVTEAYPALDALITMSGIMRTEDLRSSSTCATPSPSSRRTCSGRSASSTRSCRTCSPVPRRRSSP